MFHNDGITLNFAVLCALERQDTFLTVSHLRMGETSLAQVGFSQGILPMNVNW
jgi:hypothetical protein